MKKAFKLFAMAMMACSMTMFFACGTDPVDPDPEPEPDPEPQPEAIAVNFDGTSWTAASAMAYNYQGGLFMYAFSNADQQSLPIAMVYAGSVEPGTYTDSFDEDAFSYTEGNIGSIDYYEEYAISYGNGGSYGDWWAKTATYTVNSYDATSMLLNANVNAVMFSALEAFVSDFGAVGMDAASTANMTMAINFTLTPYGKALPMMQKTNKLFVK